MSLTRWCCSGGGRRSTVVTGAPSGRLSLAETRPRQADEENRCGIAATGTRGTLVTGRLSLADAVLTEGRPSALAALFDQLPGLTVAAVPVGASYLLLRDRTGDSTLVRSGDGELAAAAACLWLSTGRRLPALAAIRRLERRSGPVQRCSLDVGQQLDRLGEVGAGLVVGLGDFGQRQQHLRLVHR